MAQVSQELITRMISAYRRGCRLALLFDYDGTLTPFVEHPALARLEPPTMHLLKQLVFRPGISVGIISGRSLDDLWELMDVPGLYYAGTSGLEFDMQGERHVVAAALEFREIIGDAGNRLSRLARDYPGAFVERKDLGLTLHYRRISPDQVALLLAEAMLLLRDYEGQLAMVEGPLSWEISPRVAWDKSAAICHIVESIGPPVFPFYAGASANDRDAFATVSKLGGISLGVGACAPPTVRWRIETPDELVRFLSRLNRALDAPGRDARSAYPADSAWVSTAQLD